MRLPNTQISAHLLMLREFQVSFGSGSALVLGLAEAAPFTTQEIPISGEGQFCGGLQYFVCPAVERVFVDLERADVLPSRLVDGHEQRKREYYI